MVGRGALWCDPFRQLLLGEVSYIQVSCVALWQLGWSLVSYDTFGCVEIGCGPFSLVLAVGVRCDILCRGAISSGS